jgi:transposase-like protein
MTKEEKITHWRAVIQKHATSGLSAAAFCREHDLGIHQFRWWQRRFRNENSPGKESGFFQLVPFSKSQHSGVRIRLHNGVLIEIEKGFDPMTLRGVIEAICERDASPCSR